MQTGFSLQKSPTWDEFTYARSMTLLRWLAAPLAPLYGAVVRLRNRAFDEHPERMWRVSRPVVSIGNLTTGGTGKTPVTLFLAQGIQAAGLSCTVVSRGYGGRREVDPMDVEPSSDPAQTGDEPLLMARALGDHRVFVGRKRHAAALRSLAWNPDQDCLLLDDGFQHRALHRDVDLLLLDGVRRWGNGRMLPLGDLREPMDSAGRASALVVTRGSRADRASMEAWWQRYGSGGPIFFIDFAITALRRFDTSQRIEASASDIGPLFAFCALGHPDAFYADLLLAGCPWVGTRSFRDHQRLTASDLGTLEALALRQDARGLVCTEKDAIKLDPDSIKGLQLPLWISEQRVLGGEALLAYVLQRVVKASEG